MGIEHALILIGLVLAIGITALAMARHDTRVAEPEPPRYQPDQPIQGGE